MLYFQCKMECIYILRKRRPLQINTYSKKKNITLIKKMAAVLKHFVYIGGKKLTSSGFGSSIFTPCVPL